MPELETLKADFTQLLSGWTPVAELHRTQLGEGWELATDFAELHYQALRAISTASGERPEQTDEAVILVGTHALNLLLASLTLIARGQFDVVAYLMRGILDSQSLLFAVASDEALGARYLDDRLEASQARKRLVAFLRENNWDEEADHLDRAFRADADSANDLAHANVLHGDKLLERLDGRVTPIVLGHADVRQATDLLRALLVHERWALTWLAAFRTSQLTVDWTSQFTNSGPRLATWMNQGGGDRQ